MALPDFAKIAVGTPIVVADTTDYANNSALGTRTDQIDLTGLTSGAARQSDKITFPDYMNLEYVLQAALEFATAPVAGEVVNFFMAWSNSATAGTGNPGGIGGSDAAYTGTTGGTLAESLKQLHFLGSMVMTPDATTVVQIDTAIATFTPRAKYGTLVVENATSDDMHSDAVEMGIAMLPLIFSTEDTDA